MPHLSMIPSFLREVTCARTFPREPEPALVMDGKAEVAAYTEAGRIDGVMAAAYLFHSARVSQAIHGCQNVIDLGCGPATQLAQVAELNPDISFHGVDLSPAMLESAGAHIRESGLKNVQFSQGDITRLDHIATAVTPLVQLLAQVTHHDAGTIHPGSRIVGDLGVDSLMRIELVSCIEEELNVAVDENCITPQTTVADLEARIAAQAVRSPLLTDYPRWSLSPWVNVLRPLVRGALVTSWIHFVCRLKVSGAEHLETLAGPVIFMANHRSFLDSPVALMVIPRRLRSKLAIAAATGVLYERFRWIAPLADLTYNSYPFPTEAFENIKTGLEYTGRLLDDGWNVLIFPEGQMRRDSTTLLPLKGGAGVLAVEMQVPVVPMVIVGTDRIVPPDRLVPRCSGIVQVRFGTPICAEAGENYLEAARRIEAAMHALLAQVEADFNGQRKAELDGQRR